MKLNDEEQKRRAPRPPAELVGALQDHIYVDRGKTRIAKSIKVKSRKAPTNEATDKSTEGTAK